MNAGTKFPKTVGGCLAELAQVMRAAAILQAKLAPYATRETELREHLLATFRKDELTGTNGSGLALAVTTTRVPTIAEGGWDRFWAFAIKAAKQRVNGKLVTLYPNSDLLNRGVSSPAWRERIEQNIIVPGIVPFDRIGLRVTKVKGKEK